MSTDLKYSVLHASPTVQIRDVCCRARHGACGQAESSDRTSIAFVRRGAFVRRAGKNEDFADSTRVLFFNKDHAYCVDHPVEGGDDCTSFTFHPVILEEALGRAGHRTPLSSECRFPWTQAVAPSDAFASMQRVRNLLRHKPASALGVEEECMQLLSKVIPAESSKREHQHRADTRSAHRRLALDARALLTSRFREPLSLSDIARQVHSSPYHLARIFSRHAGCSMHRHLVRMRLREALERLCDQSGELTALALELGFSSHSHFSSAFRREFGFPPSAVTLPKKKSLRQMSKILKAADWTAN